MRITEEQLKGPFYDSQIFFEYFGGMRIAAADIETTGLSPKHNSFFLGGLVAQNREGRVLKQFFAGSPEEEAECLQAYSRALAEYDVIVTYNGNAFDIPFLVKRMRKYGMDPVPLQQMYSLDLYRIIRKYSHLKQLLPDLKQKTVEAYLGDEAGRKDRISGAEVAAQYARLADGSLASGREEIIGDLLLHNRDDVAQLSEMMRILRQLDLHRILYEEGIPLMAGGRKMIITDVSVRKNEIRAKGVFAGPITDYSYFGDGMEMQVAKKKRKAEMRVQLEDVSGYLVADVRGMGIDDEPVRSLGGYESGYLIIKDRNDRLQYHEINRLLACAAAAVLQ